MARPKKGEEIAATHMIGIRVNAELREKLDAKAAASGRSISDEARLALEKHVGLKKR